jgi:hypothetical protein
MDLKKKKPTKAKEQGQRKLSNLLALDFANSGLKAVRLKKVKDRIVLSAADILPPINLDAGEHPELPKPLAAYYTSLCASTKEAHLRVFGHVLQDSEKLQDVIRDSLSVSADHRVAGRVLIEGRGKRESTILGVAIPENVIGQYLDLFASGAPAPHSLELSGLAAFSAFLFNRGKQTANQTVCLIEAGRCYTYVGFLHHNQLQVVNRFNVGGESLQRQVQVALGVDEEMAGTILSGGSVDVAAPVRTALAPFVKQLSIYREYVERQNKTTLSGVYMSGGEAKSSYWQSAVQEVLGLAPVIWNPFEKIEGFDDSYPDQLKGQESRFAAAVGAALAGMEAI